jgi:hypothetical protein
MLIAKNNSTLERGVYNMYNGQAELVYATGTCEFIFFFKIGI